MTNQNLASASPSVWAIVDQLRVVSCSFSKVVVAFSGGMDSTVALFLALLALNREKVLVCTVDWGPYFSRQARQNIEFIVKTLGVEHLYLPGQETIESVAKGGPACNLCTKKAKLGTIRNFFGADSLIIGGSNRSDSWGKRGIKLLDNTYSPLFELEKEDIWNIIHQFQIPIRRTGENKVREGCFLKHLYKPLVSSFHAQAVIESNQLLLDFVQQNHFPAEIANVKIIGPLKENIALVNLRPSVSPQIQSRISHELQGIAAIQKVIWVDKPLTLVARMNVGQYRNDEVRYWLHRGRIQPDFAWPVSIKWMPSTNRRLSTFQVVDVICN